jgi:inward rectifier potassium channel
MRNRHLPAPRPTPIPVPGADYVITVVGDRSVPLRDFYHGLLRGPWWLTIAAISGTFLVANALFALAYLATGGVHAAHWSFADAFFFSVQTMGTIGYGALYPESAAANTLMVAETLTSLTLTALATGLVFAKFSRPTTRLMFSKQAVISPMNGVPTLMFRISNQRGNQIVDALIRVVIVRKEQTIDSGTFYRMLDLRLSRERALSLSRSWAVLHPIEPDSPLRGATPESMTADETEIGVMVVGLDGTSMQPIHASHRYYPPQIVWGARHVDILSDTPDGNMLLDLRRFHEIEPTTPTDAFPYPR